MTPRPTRPLRWQGLVATGTAMGLALAGPALAQGPKSPTLPATSPMLWLAQAEGGEGGEGGEAGAVADVGDDVAYLAQLDIVEGHLAAAALMYRKGLVDEAVGLSYHPEAEMMEEVRARLAARGAADITPAMEAFSAAMEQGAAPDAVDAALAAVSAAIAAAEAPERDEGRTRLDALVVLLRAAASEYAEATEDGTVGEVTPYYEAHGFVAVAKARAAALAAEADPAVAKAGTKARAALDAADEAFGDLATADPVARDPAILLGVAARVELAAGAVR